MSLKVWLPLLGDLNEQGISAVAITNGGGVTTNDAGKIGKCMSFNGSATGYLRMPTVLTTNAECSIAFWMKLNNTTATHCLFSERVAADGAGYSIFYIANSGIRWDEGASLTSTTPITANTWYHVVCCKDVTKKYIYINGVLSASSNKTTQTASKINTNYALIGGSQANATGSTPTGNYLNGYLNDYRIYDHALSAAEVREIAQGLVLHYKLNSPPNINNNLYTGSKGFTGTWNNYTNNRWTVSTETYPGFTVLQRSSSWNGLSQTVTCAQGDIFTLSFYAKVQSGGQIQSVTSGATILDGNFSSGSTSYWIKTTDDGTNWKRYWATAKITSDITSFTWAPENTVDGKIFYICGMKLEKGEVHTGWSPAASEAGETNLVYDSSGYGHNGTVTGTPTISTDSPRYSYCTHFVSGQKVATDGLFTTPNPIFTANFWVKMYSNTYTAWKDVMTFTGNKQFRMEVNNASGQRLAWYNYPIGTSNGILNADVNYDEWNMLTLVWNGSSIITYKNGVQTTSVTISGTEWIPDGGFSIGDWGMYMYMSDARIYCTALSPEDILALYHTSAKVDNKANFHTFEINENSVNKLTKTGIMHDNMIESIKTLPDGSCWQLLLFHYVDGGNNLFTSSNATDCNEFGLYSRLKDINNFTYNGKYEFYVIQDDIEYRWTQTNQPTASAIAGLTTVSGYTNPVNGLAKANQSNTYIGYNAWWGACGCWTQYTLDGKTGIPGFGTHNANGICTKYLALYARIEKADVKLANQTANSFEFIEF